MIFTQSLVAQTTALIVAPVNRLRDKGKSLPYIILIDGLDECKGIDLDGKITVHRTERADTSGQPQGRMDKVSAAVAAINQKLSKAGVMRSGVPIDNKGPDAGAFHATLEINDFPRKFSSFEILAL